MLGQQRQLSVYCYYVVVHVRSVNFGKGGWTVTVMEQFATLRGYQLVGCKIV